jgi:hypothetical protein
MDTRVHMPRRVKHVRESLTRLSKEDCTVCQVLNHMVQHEVGRLKVLTRASQAATQTLRLLKLRRTKKSQTE